MVSASMPYSSLYFAAHSLTFGSGSCGGTLAVRD